MANPITPSQVIASAKKMTFPDSVINAFNNLIKRNWTGTQSRFTQTEAIAEIQHFTTLTKQQIYDYRYLDVEGLYAKAGWEVKYDKPGYNEDYEAFFVFTKNYQTTNHYC